MSDTTEVEVVVNELVERYKGTSLQGVEAVFQSYSEVVENLPYFAEEDTAPVFDLFKWSETKVQHEVNGTDVYLLDVVKLKLEVLKFLHSSLSDASGGDDEKATEEFFELYASAGDFPELEHLKKKWDHNGTTILATLEEYIEALETFVGESEYSVKPKIGDFVEISGEEDWVVGQVVGQERNRLYDISGTKVYLVDVIERSGDCEFIEDGVEDGEFILSPKLMKFPGSELHDESPLD